MADKIAENIGTVLYLGISCFIGTSIYKLNVNRYNKSSKYKSLLKKCENNINKKVMLPEYQKECKNYLITDIKKDMRKLSLLKGILYGSLWPISVPMSILGLSFVGQYSLDRITIPASEFKIFIKSSNFYSKKAYDKCENNHKKV